MVIQLNGRLNKTGVISPRFNVSVDNSGSSLPCSRSSGNTDGWMIVETWMNLLLPARSFGKIILTTSAGIMDHEEARRKHVSYSRNKVKCTKC